MKGKIKEEEYEKRVIVKAGRDVTVWLLYDREGKKILAANTLPFNADVKRGRDLLRKIKEEYL